VSEFDEEYEQRLAEAQRRAGSRGRDDVLDYLAVRASNDRLRARGVEWLLDSFTALAGELNRAGAGLTLQRTESHRFRVGHSTMVGTRLVLRNGIRELTIEAGWPRTPRDGIVRGGGLACARVSHFGAPSAGEELLLAPWEAGGARWLASREGGPHEEFLEDGVRLHVGRLLGGK
jgi:hypothetical protein